MTNHDCIIAFNVLCVFGSIPALYAVFYAFAWVCEQFGKD